MTMTEISRRLKTVVVGAGPVGTLTALYAAVDGGDVELYELRSGKSCRGTDEALRPVVIFLFPRCVACNSLIRCRQSWLVLRRRLISADTGGMLIFEYRSA